MATVFAAFGKSLGNNKGSVQNFGIVGLTITAEEITKFIFFYCPCDYPANKIYGSIFIWGPAVILLIAGYLANRRTWRLTTGLCNRTQGIGRGGKRIFHFIFIFLSVGIKAMIAPATWIVLAFLKGDYYACASWPDPEDTVDARVQFQLKPSNNSIPKPCMYNPNPAKFNGDKEAEIIARNLRAHSHVIGWFYVSLGLLLGVCGMFCMRCRSKYSYEQSNYIDRYRSNEVKLFEDELDKKAEEQAKRIVEGYFSKVRAKEDWDQIAVINDKVTRSKRGKAIYSPLHKFVNRELRALEDAEAIPDLVSDAAMKKRKPVTMTKKKKGAPKNGSSGESSVPGIQMMPIQAAPRSAPKPTYVVVENERSVPKVSVVNPSSVSTPAEKPAVPAFHTQPREELSSPENPNQSEVPKIINESAGSSKPNASPSPEQQETAVEKITSPTYPAINSGANSSAIISVDPEPAQPAESFPDKDETEGLHKITETSLGDFGGAISREDLAAPDSSGESNAEEAGVIVFEGQELPPNVDANQSGQRHEGYVPLLENGDETPLLSDE